ncbi:MAG: hypothetical protein HY079_11245, partial [Elusimicrobia bacterium]|nr:hypothetical protein [Elusimicrobiota bacterium]
MSGDAPRERREDALFAGALAAVLAFAAFARGAHDYWAATAVYLAALAVAAALFAARLWPEDAPGLSGALLAPLGAVAAAMTLSFLGSARPSESWFGLMDWLSACAFLFAAQHCLRGERARRVLLAGAALVAAVELTLILRQHWALAVAPDAPRAPVAALRYWLSMQVPGTLVNSSAATAFLLLWTPPLLSRAAAARRGGESGRALWTAGAACALAALLSLDSTWG